MAARRLFVIDGQYTLTNIGADQYVRRRPSHSNAPSATPPPRRRRRVRLLIFDDRHQQSRTATAAVRGVVQPSRDTHRDGRTGTKVVSDQVMLKVYFGGKNAGFRARSASRIADCEPAVT
jgi:hypothetical protein